MKIWKGLLFAVGGSLAILLFFLIVPVIIMNESWWWFFVPLIVFIIAGIIFGIILIIINFKKKPLPTIKIDLKDAQKRIIHEAKYDNDNPDNFYIKWSQLVKIGEKGAEKTPIGIFYGKGTELNETRIAIVNLNNPKQETTHLIDPTKEDFKEAIRLIADNPPEEIKEEITTGYDFRTGMPTTTTRIRRPSSVERQLEQEKKETEERGAI